MILKMFTLFMNNLIIHHNMANVYLPEAHQHNSQYYAYNDLKKINSMFSPWIKNRQRRWHSLNVYFHNGNISIITLCPICVTFFGQKFIVVCGSNPKIPYIWHTTQYCFSKWIKMTLFPNVHTLTKIVVFVSEGGQIRWYVYSLNCLYLLLKNHYEALHMSIQQYLCTSFTHIIQIITFGFFAQWIARYVISK